MNFDPLIIVVYYPRCKTVQLRILAMYELKMSKTDSPDVLLDNFVNEPSFKNVFSKMVPQGSCFCTLFLSVSW